MSLKYLVLGYADCGRFKIGSPIALMSNGFGPMTGAFTGGRSQKYTSAPSRRTSVISLVSLHDALYPKRRRLIL